MIIVDERLFLKRTGNIFSNQRKRAAKDYQRLGYTLAELRQKARVASNCPFCQCCLTTECFSLDHRKPVARGGSWNLDNLAVCCRRCNEVKHVLDNDEMAALIAVVLRMSPQAQSSIFTRLRAGPVYRGKVKR